MTARSRLPAPLCGGRPRGKGVGELTIVGEPPMIGGGSTVVTTTEEMWAVGL